MKLFIMHESVNIEITLQCVQCYNNLRTMQLSFNPLSAKPTKWSNTLKQFVFNLPTNCLNVFDHFVILPRKGLKKTEFVIHNQREKLQNAHRISSSFITGHICEWLTSHILK